ncbi:MAG: cyclic nucleotide-binding/CBS domain-containing protein [Bacteroidota bacterium]
MDDEIINEDLSIMDERLNKSKVLDSKTFLKPVKDLKPATPIMVDIEDTLEDALKFMQVKQFGCILITKGDVLAGILTERDVIAKAIGHDDFQSMKVKDIMTPRPEAFQLEDEIAYVVKAMCFGGYRHVPIVNSKNEPVGMLSVKDIMRFIVDHFPEEIMNLPPNPIRKSNEFEGG